jgi:hypothetical protein
MPSSRTPLPGSHRSAPPGKKTGAVNPDEQAEISVYLKAPPASSSARATLRQTRSDQLAAPIGKLRGFAAGYGLKVTLEDPARRLVKLAGLSANCRKHSVQRWTPWSRKAKLFEAAKVPSMCRLAYAVT